jgi:uncharacterized membrane protein YgcG
MCAAIRSKLQIFFLGTAAALLLGCPDPGDRFDEFVERTEGTVLPTGELGRSQLENLAGRYLLLASVQLAPTTPLLFDVQITSNMSPDGTCPGADCRFSMDVQPLRSPRVPRSDCPANFEPAGQPFQVPDVSLNPNGSFRAVLPTVTVDGCANPITGRDIEAALILEAVTKSTDVFCGNLRGQVLQPIQLTLDRSTFAAVRINAAPTELDPVPDLLACPPDGGTGGTGGAGGEGGAGGTGGSGGEGGAGGGEG